MSKEKLKAQLSLTALGIAEKCVAGALAATGVVTIASGAIAAPNSPDETRTVMGSPLTSVTTSSEGAILLNIVHRDPVTGEMVATHYSHGSHASHASHVSHYSSR